LKEIGFYGHVLSRLEVESMNKCFPITDLVNLVCIFEKPILQIDAELVDNVTN